MKFIYALIAGGLIAALPVRAVYAPIPEQEQGKDITVTVHAGASYDSNIFGGATDAIGSNVYELSPRVVYNASVTDQTFFSANYGLRLDEIQKRPGEKLLDSHDLTLRLAHAFSQSTNIDLTNVLTYNRNPESLLNGQPVNVDQTYTSEQLDGRFVTSITPKIGLEFKARGIDTRYRNSRLARDLDRLENLYGAAANYAILPEVKAVAEYRHLDEYYWTKGEDKNKRSDYAMGGFDYEVAKKLTLTSRFGAEWRRRARAGNTTGPFVEVSGRYDYGEKSFLTGGYAYTFDESSDPSRFTDQKVNRLFVNVQLSLTALIIGSVMVDYEPAVLQARPDVLDAQGQRLHNLNETTTRVGGALSYLPTKNWTVSATYDLDHVQSDDPSRAVVRHRVGVSAGYTF